VACEKSMKKELALQPSKTRHPRLLPIFSVLILTLGLASAASAQPTFDKGFFPATIGPGSVSTLVFTIENTGGTPLSDLAFTDVLPAGVLIATPAFASTTCPNAILSAPEGGGTITLSDGELGSFETCTVSVDVTSTVVTTHMNVSGDLTSDAGNSGNATADLTVASDRPGFSKSFSPSTVPLGSRSTLTFTIDNTLNAADVASITFSDDLPPGLVVADPANVVNTCTATIDPPGPFPPIDYSGGTVTAVPGTGTISLSGFGSSGAAVPLGASCAISVDVVSGARGQLDNVTSSLSSAPPFGFSTESGKASARLTVDASEVNLSKSFLGDPVPPGGTVVLEFTLRSFNRTDTAVDVGFSDDLGVTLTGLAVSGPLPTDPCGAGSSLSGTSTLTLTGGTLPPEGTCTFSVTLAVPPGATPGIYTNTTSQVTYDFGGGPELGLMASDHLFVFAAPSITKTFLDNPVAAGDTTRLEFTITNTSATDTATDVAVTDVFDIIMPTASAVPAAECCGVGSSCTFTPLSNPPASSSIPAQLSVTGGTLAPGASCTFEITLDVTSTAAAGFYDNTTTTVTATVDGSEVIGNPAMDVLEVVGGTVLAKEFTDDPVSPGDTVTLQFTLTHDQNAVSDATAINFTDDLDAALMGLVATGLPMNDICGMGSQLSGTDTLSFTGGTLAPGASCQFSVTLQVPMGATAGIYTNTTSDVTATVSGLVVTTPAASDDLVVAGLTLMKEFTDDPVIPGGSVTLQFTLTNEAGAPAASIIQFSDSLSSVVAGLTYDPGSIPVAPCGVGSSISLSSGNTNMTLMGGDLGAGEMCQFSLTVDVGAGVASGVYNNVTSSFFAIIDGNLLFLENAADELVVAGDLLLLTKTFLTNPVAPGATVGLEFELTNLSLSGTATGITFTDDLDAALSGLQAITLPADGFCGAGSQLTGAGLLTLTGAELGPGASCTFTATLQVPAMPAAAAAVNITSSVAGTIGGLGVTGDPASDTLEILNVAFTKAFAGPTVTDGTVVLTFTIDNLVGTPIDSLGFTDDLDAALPGMVATGLPLVDVCGSGSSINGTNFLTFTGGSLAGNASCSFNVTLQLPGGVTPSTFFNTTSDLFSAGLAVAAPATDVLSVEPPPTFAKVFAPDVIATTNVSTLTFTIDNSASALDATSLDFTDNLPAGVVVANPANASTTCTGGTLTAIPASGTITYTGGTVVAGLSCTVSVDVTSATVGAHVNTTGDLTSSSGNSGTASDTLTVEGPPLFSKAFAPALVPQGGISTLTFTIDNTGTSIAATGLDFTDNLPSGMEVANPANASTTCTGGTITAVPGSSVVTYSGGTVAASTSCSVSVDIVATAAGSLVNTTGELTSSAGSSGTATDTLEVDGPPLFSKSFAPTTVALDEPSTLTFTIDNSASAFDATGLDFTDNLPSGMEVADPANEGTTCVGGTLIATPGTTVVSYTGGTASAGTVCEVFVDVVVTDALGVKVNVTEELSSSLGSSGTTTANLTISDNAIAIPTLEFWGLLLLGLGLGLAGFWRISRG